MTNASTTYQTTLTSIALSLMLSATGAVQAQAPIEQENKKSQSTKEDSSLWSRMYFNFGFSQLSFDSESSPIILSNLDLISSLAISEGPIEGGTSVTGDTQPSITIGYRLKNFPKVAIETVIAPPFEFELGLTGGAANKSLAPFALCPTPGFITCIDTGIPELGSNLGTTRALPANITATYNFDSIGRFAPYVGLGLSYLYFDNEKVTNQVLTETGNPKLTINSAFSLIFQVGASARISNNLTLVVDMKLARGVEADNSLNDISLVSPTLGDLLGPASIGEASSTLTVDANVLSAGLRYRF